MHWIRCSYRTGHTQAYIERKEQIMAARTLPWPNPEFLIKSV